MASRPAFEAAGAGAVGAAAHTPALPGVPHDWPIGHEAVAQHVPSTQKPVAHCDGVVHSPPCGTGVPVGVPVAVGVAVDVTVPVGVATGVPSMTAHSCGRFGSHVPGTGPGAQPRPWQSVEHSWMSDTLKHCGCPTGHGTSDVWQRQQIGAGPAAAQTGTSHIARAMTQPMARRCIDYRASLCRVARYYVSLAG